jgi:hypothetical protein
MANYNHSKGKRVVEYGPDQTEPHNGKEKQDSVRVDIYIYIYIYIYIRPFLGPLLTDNFSILACQAVPHF